MLASSKIPPEVTELLGKLVDALLDVGSGHDFWRLPDQIIANAAPRTQAAGIRRGGEGIHWW
jgi:hypothetical protein